jgi:mono/diheme cytochrome c family protein
MRTVLASVAASFAIALPAQANQEPSNEPDPRKLFASNCAWCHNNFGLEAGKGPKLAGTRLSHQGVMDRIANGKSGMMPAYRKQLSEREIQALAEYIKALPTN